jgi:hypothetical protein
MANATRRMILKSRSLVPFIMGGRYSRATENASLTICATVVSSIPRATQYFDRSQTERDFCPLLELQAEQQRAMFSRVMIRASLMMCSQVAAAFRELPRGTL